MVTPPNPRSVEPLNTVPDIMGSIDDSLLFSSDTAVIADEWISELSAVELIESLLESAAQTALQSITARKNVIRRAAPRFLYFKFSPPFSLQMKTTVVSYFQMIVTK